MPFENVGLAAGDFNGDQFDDLAVTCQICSVLSRNIGGVVSGAGAVFVFFGSDNGLQIEGNVVLTRDFGDIRTVSGEEVTEGGQFGAPLAAGDFDADGFDDLVIGSIRERDGKGGVLIVYGAAPGFIPFGPKAHFTQSAPPTDDISEARDFFGSALATGDINGDGFDDLVVGVLGEDLGEVEAAGAIKVLYGSDSGVVGHRNQDISRDSEGIAGAAGKADAFGSALAAADFNNDGHADVAIGAPQTEIGDAAGAGTVNVIYGAASGLVP